jgi:hypothetical protein
MIDDADVDMANPIEPDEAEQKNHEQGQENRPQDGLALPNEHLEGRPNQFQFESH